ncbi:platelet endothelial cell adhesion molecule-like isoform X2 [Amblyraja radiata]|uniref:platelet endothelial cell adhesion molecule-like isoform X2 n=1 Tax=Amblyraja radiata TaxID=386614 RepID=UPI0014024B17|nr:platelet endothelial cell adhesion molecule-like isoform X2 [Amblyraja radiata]
MSKTTILFITQLLCGIGHVQTDVEIHKTEIKSDPEALAQAGNSITLTCSVTSVATSRLPNQITYRFYKGSQKNVLLNTSMIPEPKYSFTIQSARATHTGYYVCVVNVGDQTATSGNIYIEVTGQIQRPRLTIQPMKVIVGNEIGLSCDAAEEIPPLDFTFYKYKNGKPSPVGQKGTNTNFVTHTLKVTETTDQVYSCKFKGRSLATTSTYSEPVTITVQDPFSSHLFTIEPQSRIFEGDDFTMRCTVQMSSLVPSYTKVELTITKGTTPIAKSVTGEAKISKKATADDTGLYTCHAKWKETLKILEKQVTVAVPVSKPSLRSTAFNSIVAQGDCLHLTCAVVRGSWPIIYTFYKGTPENSLYRSILNATAGVYTIPSADTADSGEYFCQAENNAGVKHRSERSQNININVKGTKPMWLEYHIPRILAFLLLFIICCYVHVKYRKIKRRKIVKQQNQGSVKENTVAVYSKVKEKAHPNEDKDYVNIPSSKGTGTDSECDCEMN